MKKLSRFKFIALALGCATLAMTTIPAEARSIKAHAGTTFTLAPELDASGNPTGRLTHTVDGVARASFLGNCTVHFDVIAVPSPDGSFSLAGTFRITSADVTLEAEVEGVVTPVPGTPFGNFNYNVRFTGDAHGRAKIDGVAMFTSPGGGTATWELKGNVHY